MKKYFIFFGLLTLIILITYLLGKRQSNEIENNKQFTSGQITGYQNLFKPTCYDLKYTYTVDGKTYKNFSSGTSIAPKNYKYFEGKFFPVVYSKIHPEKSEILIMSDEFKNWGLHIPDSLKWVEQYDYF